ncbi:MAG: dicarboxylate transporter, DctM subunit [Planctomycetaceae bacterium]|nr:dicarboxylate transporter, DctM subunit [Planctomycetaceae bacterium]
MIYLAHIAVPVTLLVLGMPIFLVLVTSALLGIWIAGGIPVQAIHTAMFGSLDSFSLLAVPLFIFAGDVMARGGIARRLIELVIAMVGGVRGSLALATIGAASAFGAMSGSSVACVAAIGKLTLPSLERNGYGRLFGVSLITATGVIDVIIPPSIPMIIYGIAAQQSVTTLFLAGIVPGLIVALALSIYVVIKARAQQIPVEEARSWPDIRAAGKRAVWSILAPIVILGGIYGGLFTPTEAAGVACLYSIAISVYVHRELSWKNVWDILQECAVLVGQIMIIVAAAGAYSWFITTSGLAGAVVDVIKELHLSTWMLLLVINCVLLCVGSVLEPPAAILILMPLLMPVTALAGIDPIHFGIVVTVNLAIGMFLPPFGLNLFASHAIFNTPLPALYRGVVPFLLIYLLVLALITYIPAITLYPLTWMK